MQQSDNNSEDETSSKSVKVFFDNSIDSIENLLNYGKDFPSYIKEVELNKDKENRRRTTIRGMPLFIDVQVSHWLDNHKRIKNQYEIDMYITTYGCHVLEKFNPLTRIIDAKATSYQSISTYGDMQDRKFKGRPFLADSKENYRFDIYNNVHGRLSKLAKTTATTFTDLVIVCHAIAVIRAGSWSRDDNREKAILLLDDFVDGLDGIFRRFERRS